MSVFFVFSLRRKSSKKPEYLAPYSPWREVKEAVLLLQKLDLFRKYPYCFRESITTKSLLRLGENQIICPASPEDGSF